MAQELRSRSPRMIKPVSPNAKAVRALSARALLGIVVASVLLLFATPTRWAQAPKTQLRRNAQRASRKTASRKPRIDYSQFLHSTHVENQKLSCESCHKFPTKNWKKARKADEAFADVTEFPEHSSCLNCHREQFFARERPAPKICSNCHVQVSPRDTTRFLFPSLGDVSDPAKKRRDFVSEFVVNFPHDKHMEVLGSNDQPSRKRGARFAYAGFQKEKPKEESDPKSCLICHQTYQPQGDSTEEYVTKPPKDLGDAFWLKKGSFRTIPVSHAPCSNCHSADGGIDPMPSKCEVCHKLLPAQKSAVDFEPKLATTMAITDRMILNRWQRRESAGTFLHDGGGHPSLNCTTCHNIPAMNTTDPKSLKVAVKSCGGAEGCHVTATSDEGGALNYEIDQRKAKADFQCTKCHLVFGKEALPASHMDAIPMAVNK